ncbi:esterase family protein, partial [Burkholderia sp. Ac-20392]|nr:esterase family protein [Burkholderia sp. Ac-20392]
MRRLALPFALALIAGSIATARATPPAPAVSP